MVCGV